MDRLLNDKISPAVVGFCQAVGVVVYTVLVASFITVLEKSAAKPPDFVVAPIFLTLFVFSAGITGTVVFGLPVYFTFAKKDVTRAVSILAYTFGYIFVAIVIAASVILLVY